MTSERDREAASVRPPTTSRGEEVVRALSRRFRERGWECELRLRRSPAGDEEIIVVDQGAVSPDHAHPNFPVDGRAVEAQVEQVLAELDHQGWAGPPLERAALWCEPA